MAARIQTHYEILGIPRDAKNIEVGKAYNRAKAELNSETVPPDPRRAILLDKAYATLSDEEQRAAYDATLAQERTVRRSRKRVGLWVGMLTGALVLAGYFFYESPESAAQRADAETIRNATALALARVESIDVSGKITPLGLAFSVERGVMVADCSGIVPGAQLVAEFPPRRVPVRVAAVNEELGLCKLTGDGVGSWPLPVSTAEPHTGDRIFATHLDSSGSVALFEGKVKRLIPEGGRTIVDAGVSAAIVKGAPLLDARGQVVGVALPRPGTGERLHVRLPQKWAVTPPEADPPAPPRYIVPPPKPKGDPFESPGPVERPGPKDKMLPAEVMREL